MAEREPPHIGKNPRKTPAERDQSGGNLTGDEAGKGSGTDFGVGYGGGDFSRDPEDGQNAQDEERYKDRNSGDKKKAGAHGNAPRSEEASRTSADMSQELLGSEGGSGNVSSNRDNELSTPADEQ